MIQPKVLDTFRTFCGNKYTFEQPDLSLMIHYLSCGRNVIFRSHSSLTHAPNLHCLQCIDVTVGGAFQALFICPDVKFGARRQGDRLWNWGRSFGIKVAIFPETNPEAVCLSSLDLVMPL